MSKFVFFFFAVMIMLATPAVAQQQDELFNKWYAGDWVTKTQDTQGRAAWYGMRIMNNSIMYGCLLYPNKDGEDLKLFGQIFDMGSKDIEVRLSNGYEVTFYKIGKEPRNILKFHEQVDTGWLDLEFSREFLPASCI